MRFLDNYWLGWVEWHQKIHRKYVSWRNTLRSEPLFPPLLYFQSKEVTSVYVPCLGCQRDTANRWGPTVEEPSISAAATGQEHGGKGAITSPSDCRGCFQTCRQERQRQEVLIQFLLPEDSTIRGLTQELWPQEVGIWSFRAMGYSPQPQKILRLHSPPLMEQATLQSSKFHWGENTNSFWDMTKRITFWERILSSQSADIVWAPGKSQKESQPQQDEGLILCLTVCHSSKLSSEPQHRPV